MNEAITKIDDISSTSFLSTLIQTLHEHWIEVILVPVVFFLGLGFYLWFYFQYQLMPMIDGPYYLIQVQSLLETGTLVYGDPPLTFLLLTFTTLLVGDIMVGVKVGVAFFGALSAIPAFFLMKRVRKSSLAGTLAMVFVLFSPLYLRMLSDFIKNAIGVCWLLAFIYFIHDLTFSDFNKRSLALATFFLLLTGLTHILVFGIALLFLVLYAAMGLIKTQNRKSLLKSIGVLAIATSLFVIIASLFFSWFFTDFSKILSFFNSLSEVQSSSISQPPSTGPGTPSMPNLWALSLVGGWGAILLLLSIGGILSFYVWKRSENEALLLLTAVTIVGAIICFPLIPSDYLTRFMLMLVIPAAVILSYGLAVLLRQDTPEVKFFVILLSILCVGFFVTQSISTAMALQPTISYAAYQDLLQMQPLISSDSVIVVTNQHGIYYWIQYVTNTDIVGFGSQLSPDLWQSYTHVYGIFFNGQFPSGNYTILFEGHVFTLVEYLPTPSAIQGVVIAV